MDAMDDREAQLAAAREGVVQRHKEEWDRHQAIIDEALAENDVDKARLAKVIAETLRIRQEGERKAWGLSAKGETEQHSGFVVKWNIPMEDYLK
ncbi:MAG: hypothetical protein IJU65_10650 [Desulfovibrio sp.]|nr:hypothetical protein [Desulfovibrio sp.]